MIREHDRVFLIDSGMKYEGTIGIATGNAYKGKVPIRFPHTKAEGLFELSKVRLLERPFLDFFDAIKIAEEEDVLVCEYAGYQNIVCDDRYAFTWEESQKTVKLVGEFIGMKWKIAIDN